VHNSLLGNWVKYNILLNFFIYYFFPRTNRLIRHQAPGQILTRNSSKDVELLKDVPFGGYKMTN